MWREYAIVKQDKRKKKKIQTSARNALEIFSMASSSFRGSPRSPKLKTLNQSWQAAKGLLHRPSGGSSGPPSGSAKEANSLRVPPGEATASASHSNGGVTAQLSCELALLSVSSPASSMASLKKPASSRQKRARPLSTRAAKDEVDHVLPELLSHAAGES